MIHLKRILRLVPVLLGASLPVMAAEPAKMAVKTPDPAGIEFFEKNIRPVFVEVCYKCHSAEAKEVKSNFYLDSRAGVLRGGDNGPAVVPGEPDKSRLITAIRYKDANLKMPPKKALSAEQVAKFEEWVKMGAPDPREGSPPPLPVKSKIDFDKAREFWSFRPVTDPPVPHVKDGAWPANDVDRFVLAKLEEKGLHPNKPADKLALIRRATYDLTGLPPTPDEISQFLSDESPDAFAKVVDRLLASPAYGEKWGRHWLDLVRYADTSGCNSDFPIPSAYRYRNYVIDSFNKDKPYDVFVKEQLAGDIMGGETREQKNERVVATGYLAISRRFGSRNNENWLTREDTIDNLGRTFLALSINCARCHDHKFDPIPNEDYYALYGILDSTKYAFPGTEIYRHTKDFVPLAKSEAEAEELREWEKKLADLDDKVENLGNERAKLKAKEKAGDKPEENGRTLAQVQGELLEAKQEQERLERKPPDVPKAYAVSEGKPADAKLQRKGDPKNLGEVVPRGFLQVLGGQKLDDSIKDKTSGRLQLAEWITDPTNPLTARVMVNRIWQYHFGRGLVQTPNDFGSRGKAPTHPELLDWLATRFVEQGWSVKKMHRTIMLSRAYQMSSEDDSSEAAIDPANDLLWRFNARRLSAEEIRDSMLFVAGALDRGEGGEHPFPPEAEWRYTQHKPFVGNPKDYETNHRSIYLMQQRIRKQPYLGVFDGADTNAATADRAISTTPIQALFLMNDPFAHDTADKLAVRIGLAFADEAQRIGYAFQLVYGRPATGDDIDAARQYLRAVEGQLASTDLPWDQRPRKALASLARVLLSSNEFLFVD